MYQLQTQSQMPPNRLGLVLRYFHEAYRWGFPTPPPTKAEQRRLAYDLLSNIADAGKYKSNETVDVAAAIRLAVTSAWFFSGVKLIADRIAATDARPVIKRRTGDELRNQPGHVFHQLLDRPNPLMTWEFITRYTVWWMELLGNGYIFVSTPGPGAGTPEELWPLPANAVQPIPNSIRLSRLTGKPVIDYAYTLNGKTKTLPGENVIHFRYANPFDYWMGLSPLTALMDAVKLDKYQAKYLQGFFGKDNAIPTAIISVPQETNEFDFEVIKEQIREQFGAGRRSAITRAGDMSVNVITQTLHEMEIVAARKFNREEINHILGIPEGLVSGGTSGDSRLATEITFARNTTQPLLDLLASTLDSGLSPYYGPGYVITAPSIIPQDRALALQEYAQYSLDRSINENRQERNLPPLDLIGIMEEINGIREANSLEPITTPLDDVMADLMLRIPVRLVPILSSNTSTLAGKTGLRVGQTDAGGEKVPDPIEKMQEMAASVSESGGTPSGSADAGNKTPESTGQGQAKRVAKTPDMTGAQTGSHFTTSNAGRAWYEAAMRIGQREELNRWRKVAMKEAEKGHDPADRIFETSALPESVVDAVAMQIKTADPLRVNIVFDTVIATLEYVAV